MSRYELDTRPEAANVVRAVVGWDRPLQTFFAQVFFLTQEEPDEGEATIWLGTEPGELPTPQAAIAIVEPHALVPADLVARLEADMEATVGVKDSASQAEVKQRLFGSIH
ncbi:hypothetical protein [Sphingobium algorifonticola]|jgi:hypothetical protein|uniref:Uncharacterized protein n=1 Tax=Sphingobium algorifonticola TaxID=2008318 RepID=A0A437J3Y5_9SPHN|nr:hypothetical protein [Sphingobium algorifonticola]RVT39194.1 hypothetical protein ENE74_16000 [Sphingobium algorifonticola]